MAFEAEWFVWRDRHDPDQFILGYRWWRHNITGPERAPRFAAVAMMYTDAFHDLVGSEAFDAIALAVKGTTDPVPLKLTIEIAPAEPAETT